MFHGSLHRSFQDTSLDFLVSSIGGVQRLHCHCAFTVQCYFMFAFTFTWFSVPWAIASASFIFPMSCNASSIWAQVKAQPEKITHLHFGSVRIDRGDIPWFCQLPPLSSTELLLWRDGFLIVFQAFIGPTWHVQQSTGQCTAQYCTVGSCEFSTVWGQLPANSQTIASIVHMINPDPTRSNMNFYSLPIPSVQAILDGWSMTWIGEGSKIICSFDFRIMSVVQCFSFQFDLIIDGFYEVRCE